MLADLCCRTSIAYTQPSLLGKCATLWFVPILRLQLDRLYSALSPSTEAALTASPSIPALAVVRSWPPLRPILLATHHALVSLIRRALAANAVTSRRAQRFCLIPSVGVRQSAPIPMTGMELLSWARLSMSLLRLQPPQMLPQHVRAQVPSQRSPRNRLCHRNSQSCQRRRLSHRGQRIVHFQ